MNKISKSPERYTFQKEGYIKRCEDNNKSPNIDYLNLWEKMQKIDDENESNLEWQKNNMEYDLRSTEWICKKVRKSDTYAQNLYAAICNNTFQQIDVWPILKDERWSASWRSAGGIIANMREQGDYIDWYCSGIGNGLGNGDMHGDKKYVGESIVTDEIREDLKKIGWSVLPNDEDK